MIKDEMVGWHHGLNGHEFEQTPGDSEGQGSLACYSSWDHRVRHDLAAERQQQCMFDRPQTGYFSEYKSQVFSGISQNDFLYLNM